MSHFLLFYILHLPMHLCNKYYVVLIYSIQLSLNLILAKKQHILCFTQPGFLVPTVGRLCSSVNSVGSDLGSLFITFFHHGITVAVSEAWASGGFEKTEIFFFLLVYVGISHSGNHGLRTSVFFIVL
jgi:hypothetical protein